MEPTDFAAIIAHLKGAPISTLMILLSLQRPADERTLCLFSGYCQRSVKEGLQNLLLLDLVVHIPEIGAWRPTKLALELLHNLLKSDTETEGDHDKLAHAEKIFFSGSSGSSSILFSKKNINKKGLLQQQPPKPPPKNQRRLDKHKSDLPEDPNIQQAYLLLVRTGIPSYKAADAIMATVKGGWDSEKIIDAVEGWLDYTDSEEGKSIKQPGFLIASRLHSLQDPPELRKNEYDELDPKRYTKGKYGHLIQH